MNKEIQNSWDAWKKEWNNAKSFFDSKGNINTMSKLKTKWNKEFVEMLQLFYNKGKVIKK